MITTQPAENTNTTPGHDGHTPTHYTLALPLTDKETGKLYLPATETNTPGHYASLTINTRRYDLDTKKWVEDPTVAAAADETTRQLFGGTVNDLTSNPEAYAGKEFVGYTDGVHAHLTEFDPYTSYDTVDADLYRWVKANPTGPFTVAPVTLDTRMHRFNVPVTVTVNGATKTVRVSQIVDEGVGDQPDNVVSLKYGDKKVDVIERRLRAADQGEPLPAGMCETLRATADFFASQAKQRKLEELQSLFGVDFQECAATGHGIVFASLEARQISVGGGRVAYFLIGTPVKTVK